jgi:hypothetical protein
MLTKNLIISNFQLNPIHAFVDPGQGFLMPEGDGPFSHKINNK